MFAIRNYGILWEKKYIFWGWRSKPGHLKGIKNERIVDFREQSGVYILYDKDMIPIYVGQAGSGNTNLFSRLKAHNNDHLWNRWVYFSWFGLCKANLNGQLSHADNPERTINGTLRDALNDIEGVLILGIEPKLNKQGPRFRNVEIWYQVIDENTKEILSNELMLKINELNKNFNSLKKQIKT